MTEVRPHVTVSDDPSRPAFVAVLDDGTVAGGAYDHRRGTVVTFTHTEVDPSFEGQGTTAAVRDDEIWVVKPHFADQDPPSIERVTFE